MGGFPLWYPVKTPNSESTIATWYKKFNLRGGRSPKPFLPISQKYPYVPAPKVPAPPG